MDFSTWMFEKRRDKGLTFQQAADKAGTSKGYWWEVESGKSIPSIEKAEAISKALGYKLSAALKQCGK